MCVDRDRAKQVGPLLLPLLLLKPVGIPNQVVGPGPGRILSQDGLSVWGGLHFALCMCCMLALLPPCFVASTRYVL